MTRIWTGKLRPDEQRLEDSLTANNRHKPTRRDAFMLIARLKEARGEMERLSSIIRDQKDGE